MKSLIVATILAFSSLVPQIVSATPTTYTFTAIPVAVEQYQTVWTDTNGKTVVRFYYPIPGTNAAALSFWQGTTAGPITAALNIANTLRDAVINHTPVTFRVVGDVYEAWSHIYGTYSCIGLDMAYEVYIGIATQG